MWKTFYWFDLKLNLFVNWLNFDLAKYNSFIDKDRIRDTKCKKRSAVIKYKALFFIKVFEDVCVYQKKQV